MLTLIFDFRPLMLRRNVLLMVLVWTSKSVTYVLSMRYIYAIAVATPEVLKHVSIGGLWRERSMSHSVTCSAYSVPAQPQHLGPFLVDTASIVDIIVTRRRAVELRQGSSPQWPLLRHRFYSTRSHMWHMRSSTIRLHPCLCRRFAWFMIHVPSFRPRHSASRNRGQFNVITEHHAKGQCYWQQDWEKIRSTRPRQHLGQRRCFRSTF